MSDGTWVGLDVHARSVMAGLIDEKSGEVRVHAAPHRSEELVSWLLQLPAPVRTTYEAGPTGFALARALEAAGITCVIAAPGKIPRAPGARVKSERQDAERLARLLRLDELTPVRVASPTEEAVRDLVRARDDARRDLMHARHRLSKFLLCHGWIYPRGRAWTGPHAEWVRVQRFGEAASAAALTQYWGQVLFCQRARGELRSRSGSQSWPAPSRIERLVGRLRCMCGIGQVSALPLCAEIADWRRLSGRTIGSWLGLTPTESQTGEPTPAGPSAGEDPRLPAGSWWTRPGTSGARFVRAPSSSAAGPVSALRPSSERAVPSGVYTDAGHTWRAGVASARRSSPRRSPASCRGICGAWP